MLSVSTPDESSTRRYHHGDLRAAVLRAAGEVLAEAGPDAVSLREVARRAGVSHAAPYRHFPDRESLLAELAAEGFEELGRRADQAEGLAAFGRLYVDYALEAPGRFALMFSAQLERGRHARLAQASAALKQRLESAIAVTATDSDQQIAATAAWSLVHGLAHLLLAERLGPLTERDREALVIGITELFGRGLRSGPAGR